jgi:hypothetical protein
LRPTSAEDISAKSIPVPWTGCWLWLGKLDKDGYGTLGVNYAMKKAHRASYEFARGPIPPGLHIDHLCRVRCCVNPDHLEPVTCRENLMRGKGLAAINHAKTHCVHGHEFTPDNTYFHRSRRGRICKTCIYARKRAYRAAK